MTQKIINIIFLLCIITITNAQTHVNKEWETISGNPLGLDWTSSITNSSNQLISVGNTSITSQGANILTTKYNADGIIAWQQNFNTSSTKNDYGIALTEDASGNIYVVGTTDNGGSTNYDVVVLKYNSVGTLQWSNTFNSSFSKNDIGTSIKIDAIGNVYICATSEGLTTSFDYLILKYSSAGTLQWNNRYDFASLVELPIGIDIDASGDIFVTGASASSANNWDFTTARYNTSGTFLGDVRNAVAGAGLDQPLAYKKDASGNIYITGRSSTDGINYDIKTIKLNSSYVLQWTKLIDLAGKEDQGNSIDVDASGNIYVGGFSTKANNKKEAIAVKYNASGTEIWRHEQSSTNTTGDAIIKAIDATSTGEIYFVGEEKGANGTEDVVVSKIDNTGAIEWQKKLNSTVDDKPTGVNVAGDGSVYVSALKDGASDTYETIRYTEYETNPNVVYNAKGEPVYKSNELIVRFKPSAINTNAIDNTIGTKVAEYGGIDYFLNTTELNAFNNSISSLCISNAQSSSSTNSSNPCNIRAIKVFKQLKSTETTTLSRLGETIKIPDFWTTLLLEFPAGMDIVQINMALKTIPNVVKYSEPNYIALPTVGCNDPEYATNQHSIHKITSSSFTNADVNIEQAWDIVPNGGANTIRCGVFDTGLDWVHEDFGYDGTDPNSSSVIDGYNFGSNQHIKASLIGDDQDHGTHCGSIIGAIRNNSIGIGGIAGGNGGTNLNDRGIALYGMKILSGTGNFFNGNTVNYINDAIVTSSIDDPTKDYAFGFNLTSNSWRYDEDFSAFTLANNKLMREAMHFANRAKVTYCCARGNEGVDNLAIPAIIDDDWILCVGGTGNNGCFIHADPNFPGYVFPANGEFSASFGHNVDIGAPATNQLVMTMQNGGGYSSFNGTSASTPHVAGVVGLMMSYWNAPSPQYQNLAPEDCESIIQLSAKDDACISGYDQFIGHGLLDAGKALQLIEKPYNAVNHFGTNFLSTFTRTQSQVATGITVNLVEDYENDASVSFVAGSYKVNKYKIDATVNHVLNSNDNIVSFWARPSSSTVLEDVQTSGDLLPRQRVKINSCSNTACSMTGFVYEVFDMSNNPLGWWPFNPTTNLNDATFEYTILTHNNSATVISSTTKGINNISVYPNPSINENTIALTSTSNSELEINMYDLQGKLIKQIFKGKSKVGNNQFTYDISELSNGVYMYEIKLNNSIDHVKFVKQ
jgi:hypothetical protein